MYQVGRPSAGLIRAVLKALQGYLPMVKANGIQVLSQIQLL
jgi:hypothetical protein